MNDTYCKNSINIFFICPNIASDIKTAVSPTPYNTLIIRSLTRYDYHMPFKSSQHSQFLTSTKPASRLCKIQRGFILFVKQHRNVRILSVYAE